MDWYAWQIAIIGALLVLNGVFAGSEIALVSLREGQLRKLERQSRTGRVAARLARDSNRFLGTIQIGITLAGFLASATAAVTIAEPLVPVLEFLGPAARPAAIVIVTLVLTFLTLVLGELAPKRVAMQHSQRWALLVARPLNLLATLLRPAIWLLSGATNVVVRLLGGDPVKQRDEIGPEELRDLVVAHRGFTAQQRLIISGAVEIAQRRLREVLVPRREVFALDEHTPVSAARAKLAEQGHSRAPVVRRANLDDTVGVVNLRDLVSAAGGTAAELSRPAMLLPDSLHAAEALRRFKAERVQFALVVDEYGAVDGIVTLEDLVEELIGEIYDETDHSAEVRRDRDGSLLLPGTFPIHDLPDLGIQLDRRPEGGYTTVAGLVIAVLGHLPIRPGERVTVDNWRFEVTTVAGHAITGLRLRRAGSGPASNR